MVAGSINMDLVVTCSRIPAEGESMLGNSYDYVCGGKGANQAVALARLGLRVSLAGSVGIDEFGRKLRNFHKRFWNKY